jgi:hypothetical protein
MSQLTVTKEDIIDKLDVLPPETLPELQTFIEFLRFKSEKGSQQDRDEARREKWQAAIKATFGMWADRHDVEKDGVEGVEIRGIND